MDKSKLKVSVALWAHLSEYEDWRLVIASREFDALEPIAAYRLLNDSLRAGGVTAQRKPVLMILPRMRLGGQMIGERFIEDGYVYRIS